VFATQEMKLLLVSYFYLDLLK